MCPTPSVVGTSAAPFEKLHYRTELLKGRRSILSQYLVNILDSIDTCRQSAMAAYRLHTEPPEHHYAFRKLESISNAVRKLGFLDNLRLCVVQHSPRQSWMALDIMSYQTPELCWLEEICRSLWHSSLKKTPPTSIIFHSGRPSQTWHGNQRKM